VSWTSALPLRQATERGKFQAGTAVSPDVEARLAAAPEAYVIIVILTHRDRSDLASQAALMHQRTQKSNGLLFDPRLYCTLPEGHA
jgi:hypothetical protein